jgi:hypothetical protein
VVLPVARQPVLSSSARKRLAEMRTMRTPLG